MEASHSEIDVKRNKLRSCFPEKNNCFLVKAKIQLFFSQTSLPQNVKYLVGWVISSTSDGLCTARLSPDGLSPRAGMKTKTTNYRNSN